MLSELTVRSLSLDLNNMVRWPGICVFFQLICEKSFYLGKKKKKEDNLKIRETHGNRQVFLGDKMVAVHIYLPFQVETMD